MKKKLIIIPVFIPHKGCPFDCIYCNQKTISGQMDEMNEEKMKSIIDKHILTAGKDDYLEIGFYGGSFTGIEKSQQISFLEIASRYIEAGKVMGIRLSTRPDYIDRDILDYLKQYNVKTIELGVQSMDDEVLRASSRGHSPDDVIRSSELIKEYGINLGLQTMIGLPDDSREKDFVTAEKVIALGPEIVRIYPTLVIRNTYLELLYRKGSYNPPDLDEAVEICAELLDLYEKHNIKVIRVGLLATDSINNDMDVVGGPFHPAFRQLVESRRSLKAIENQIRDKGIGDKKEILIQTGHRLVSNVVGQRRSNILYLQKKYGFQRIKVEGDKGLNTEIYVN